MKRTTVTLSDELARAAEREAYRRRVSLSEVVRDALFAFLDMSEDGPRRLPFAGLGDSGPSATARDFEDVLAQEWAPARDR